MNALLRLRHSLPEIQRLISVVKSRPGFFTYMGARVWHTGLLLDQELVAETIKEVVVRLATEHYDAGLLRTALRRISIRFYVNRLGIDPELGARALWTGGWRDRGLIEIVKSTEWPDRLEKALRALLLDEIGQPKTRRQEATEVV